ncbi:MAG TPA: hypothetical protein VIJ35_19265 [Bradyrhizobium sp.]|jgi:hypothetical protein
MTVADWALVISICSAIVSLASFIWNVWSKFIYPKAKVRVHFSYVTVFSPNDRSEDYDLLSLSATNMGPGEVTLHSALVRRKRKWVRSQGHGLLNPLVSVNHRDQTAGPFSGGLPKTVAVGEMFSVYFVPNHTRLAEEGYDRIGFDDTFGRMHWAPKAQIAKVKPSIKEALEKMGPPAA